MNRYIHQLIEDLDEATLHVQDASEFCSDNFFDEDENDIIDFELFEAILEGKEKPLSQIVGIERDLLPPANRLNAQQIDSLYPHIEDLLFSYNFDLNFPDGVSTELKYSMIRDIWEDKFLYSSMGFCTIDFCDYDCDFCPFGSELCSCKKLDEME
ncbi:MAG: hypothetical protein WED10_06235 [Brumimicrobium sp.]